MKLDNWLLWKWEQKKGGGGETKIPYQCRQPKVCASSADPATWCSWRVLSPIWDEMKQLGIRGGGGFALKNTTVGVIDLDNCRDVETGELTGWAARIVERAWKIGAYVEISVSGRGVHIIGQVRGGEPARKTVHFGPGKVELFRARTQYITISGHVLGEKEGSAAVNIDALIDEIAQADAPERTTAVVPAGDHSSSGLFHRAVCRLAERGMDVGAIVQEMLDKPMRYRETKAERYGKRLRAEVQRSFDKWGGERAGGGEEIKWSKGRAPTKCMADAAIAVRALGITIRHDLFHDRDVIEGLEDATHISDKVLVRIRWMVLERFGFDPGKEPLRDACDALGQQARFDPVLDYLEGLRWDGRRRIHNWVVRYLGCPNTEVVREMGRIALIAGVRRVKSPGVKFDPCIVLEGPEGIYKSTVIETLARSRENFSNQSVLGLSDERQQERLKGVWMYEIADLKGMRYAEVEAIKAFLSRIEDKARPAYGHYVEHQARRSVLWATTNDFNYLKGTTGNRRWWPLECTEIDIEAFRADVDQLWAEAVEMERRHVGDLNVAPHLFEELRKMQEERGEPDPWVDPLKRVEGKAYPRRDGTAGTEERVAAEYLMGTVLGLKMTDRSVGTFKRVATIMRALGWEGGVLRIGGGTCRGYSRNRSNVIRGTFDDKRKTSGEEEE